MQQTDKFNPKAASKKLLREARIGRLSTLRPGSGDPFGSFVMVATAADGSPLICISALAWHTQNIHADQRVSLLLEKCKGGHPLRDPRLTLMGTVAVTEDEDDHRRYYARLPGVERATQSHDFALYKMTIKEARLVEDFGRIANVSPADILVKVDDAKALAAAEPGVVDHMNQDHAQTCRLYATKLLEAPDGAWECVDCDPEGIELQLKSTFTAVYLSFPKRVRSLGVMRKTLMKLAEKARAA